MCILQPVKWIFDIPDSYKKAFMEYPKNLGLKTFDLPYYIYWVTPLDEEFY